EAPRAQAHFRLCPAAAAIVRPLRGLGRFGSPLTTSELERTEPAAGPGGAGLTPWWAQCGSRARRGRNGPEAADGRAPDWKTRPEAKSSNLQQSISEVSHSICDLSHATLEDSWGVSSQLERHQENWKSYLGPDASTPKKILTPEKSFEQNKFGENSRLNTDLATQLNIPSR
ncbi:hypothetical protein MC885_008476, partial [Smutsia gigantea]